MAAEPLAGWVTDATISRSPPWSVSLPRTYTSTGRFAAVDVASGRATGGDGSTVTVAVADAVRTPSLTVYVKVSGPAKPFLGV